MQKGFVALTLACATIAVAPAAAQEQGDASPPPQAAEPPPQDTAPPPHAGAPPESPPGQAEPPAQDTAPPPAEEPPPPATPPAEPEPESDTAAPPQRVQIRSVDGPQPEAVPVADAVPEDAAPAEPIEPRERGERPAADARPAPADEFRRAITNAAESWAPAAGAAVATSSGPAPEPRAKETRSESVGPSQSLPARVVPRQVRDIVEVVPGEVWAVIAGLALLALALAASSWTTAIRARRLRQQREALLQEVGLLQAALLPSVPEDGPISVAYRPADGAGAGGDFYDAFALERGRMGLIVGDVSGHGRDALARTTFIRYTLRAYLDAGLEPREVVRLASAALADHLDGGFATVTVAIYDPASGRFTSASAGHPPPVVVGSAEPFEPVTVCSAPPLGIGEPTGFRQSMFTLTAGSRVCLYTDGVVEARVGGRLFGPARLERALDDLPPGSDAERVLDVVAGVADEINDDMAVCLVTAAADAPATGPRIEELEVDEHEVGDALERFLRACGIPLAEVPGILRQAGEAARREGSATVRVRLNVFRPGVDVVPGNLVRLDERRSPARGGRTSV